MYTKLGDIIGFVVALCVVILNAQNNVVSLTMAQKQAILDKHNQYRKECANGGHVINGPQYASNMVHLFWDEGLEDMAKKRASYCYFGHFGGSTGIARDFDENKENITFFEPRSGYIVGENIAVFAQNPPVSNYDEGIFTSGIDGWQTEGELYDWGNNICYADTCGHWGQLCSGPTRYVGCAFVECYNGLGGATLDIYKNGAMLLVCNYYPGVDQGNYPYEDGLIYDFCIRCQQWDVKVCENNVCVGGKARDWLASGLINSTIDQCSDGLGRVMDPCTTIDPTKAPTQGLSSSPTVVTDSPITRSPTTSKKPTRRPTLFGSVPDPTKSPSENEFEIGSDNPTRGPSISPSISNVEDTDAPTETPTLTAEYPSVSPSKTPSISPSISDIEDTDAPTETPTLMTEYPTSMSNYPSVSPSKTPSISPTITVDEEPTNAPTESPTPSPTHYPTNSPTDSPTPAPTNYPTNAPTQSPTPNPLTSIEPDTPTNAPTESPTPSPTDYPTNAPTESPTPTPTHYPTNAPTDSPTPVPSETRNDNTNPPLKSPTKSPSVTPSISPSYTRVDIISHPTNTPSKTPTLSPSKSPSTTPTTNPTNSTKSNIINPTETPTNSPTKTPSLTPIISSNKTSNISDIIPPYITTQSSKTPTLMPTFTPTMEPSMEPTNIIQFILNQSKGLRHFNLFFSFFILIFIILCM